MTDSPHQPQAVGRHRRGWAKPLVASAGVLLALVGALGLALSPATGAAPNPVISPAAPTSSQSLNVVSPSATPESLESRVTRDFLNDRDDMVRTLASGNILDLHSATTGPAVSKFIAQTSVNQVHHVTVTEEIQRTSTDVSQGTDARFPPGSIVVEERGYERATTRRTDTGAIDSVQQLQLDDKYLMREQDGLFAIADWDLSEQPVGAIPLISPAPLPGPSRSAVASPNPSPSSLAPVQSNAPIAAGPSTGGSGSNRSVFLAMLLVGAVVASGGAITMLPIRRSKSTSGIRTVAAGGGETTSPSAWRLVIRTMGRFQILEGEVDHAPRLLSHPMQSFIWLYLLVIAVGGERPRQLRETVAEQIWPKQSAATQSQRMRGRLSQRKQRLPTALVDTILDDGESLEFDLTGCWVDALEVLRLSHECGADPELKSDALLQAVARLVRDSNGPFLAFWEEQERKAVEGDDQPPTRALVEEVRGRVERARVDLLLSLGRNALWRNQAGEAVLPLEEAYEVRPDRDDLAMALADAYARSGRTAEAEHLRGSRGWQEPERPPGS